LAPNINHVNDQRLLKVATVVEEEDDTNNKKKSANSRRRRRGSRRHSSAAINPDGTPAAQPTAESDPFSMTAPATDNNNRRRKSSTNGKSRQNSKVADKEDKDSPAFQSLVDIIREMKRLPSISITTDKQEEIEEEDSNNSWKRVRRHSEPPHKMKHQQVDLKKSLRTISEQQRNAIDHEKPIFSNSFLALEEEGVGEGENNIETLVPPLNNENLLLIPPPTKRTRSKSGK
jgi:hypothetical protein